MATGGVVTSILPGGGQHEKFLMWLQRAADFFNSLTTDSGVKIPVLFRPWHEHTGSWFWWGKEHCTVDEYKQLWHITRDFFDQQGINHLLYGYSPDAQGPGDIYMERYPGDEYVDLLGLDCYHRDNEKGTEAYQQTLHTILSFMTEEGEKRNKPIALTETGLEAIPIHDWWTNVLFRAGSIPRYLCTGMAQCPRATGSFLCSLSRTSFRSRFYCIYQHPKTLFCKDIHYIYNPKD